MIQSVLATVLLLMISMNGRTQIQYDPFDSRDTFGFVNRHFIQLNGSERIDLVSQYDPDFTIFRGFENFSRIESFTNNDSTTVDNEVKYVPQCHETPVEILDSIDLNNDGVKEIFVFRQTECYVVSSVIQGCCGVGNQQHIYGSYEVWDVKLKKQIFEVKNIRESHVAVTTNVMQTFGYRFDVSLDKKGRFHVSGLTDGSDFVPGTYTYNPVKGVYEKE